MRRLKLVVADGEKGATAVLVAILLVMLMGFGALAVDAGMLWAERQQLQNGADAAALAIAQACAQNTAAIKCASTSSATADQFAKANKLGGEALGQVTALTSTSVTVEAKSVRELWLAQVLGFKTATVRTKATAAWSPIATADTLPLTIAKCAVTPARLADPLTGRVRLITKSPGGVASDENPCIPNPKALSQISGGFHWLQPDTGCDVRTSRDDRPGSNPGDGSPCDPTKLNQILQNGSLPVAVFDEAVATGAGAKYHVVGYASFTPTAYCLTETVRWNATTCTGPERWLDGYFTRTATAGNAPPAVGAPNFGTSVAHLIG